MAKFGWFVIGLGLVAQSVAAQDQCSVASLQGLSPQGVSQALTGFKTVSLTKDEFETTAAYNERVAAARRQVPSGPILVSIPQNALTKFDADAGQVTVSPYAISTTCLVSVYGLAAELKAVSFGAPSEYGEGSPYCLTKIIKSEDAGSYEATNGFGAKATVDKTNVKMEGLFFGMGDFGQPLLQGRDRFSSEPLFAFSASSDEARSLKDNAEIVLLVQPLPPFSGTGSYLSTPTFKSPRETFFQVDFLVATPICVGIRDGSSGKIFASGIAHGVRTASTKNRK